MFATHPLVIIEGLVASHNDLVAVGIGIIGVYYLLKKNNLFWGRLIFVLSAGIKYLTLPTILIDPRKKYLTTTAFVGTILLVSYLNVTSEVQPWYFLNLFIFIPFFMPFLRKLQVFFFGLLISYYPYILEGDWKHIAIKHQIIVAAAVVNLILLLVVWRKKAYSFSEDAA